MVIKIIERMLGSLIMLLASFGVIFFMSKIYDINELKQEMLYMSAKQGHPISVDDTCKLFQCKSISFKDKMYIYDKKELKRITRSNISSSVEYNDYGFDFKTFELFFRCSQYIITFDVAAQKEKLLFVFMLSLPFLLFYLMIISIIIMKDEKLSNIVSQSGNEALLANKTMINITENIHHELNTPLEVIDNKIEKVHNVMIKTLKEEKARIDALDNASEDRITRYDTFKKLDEDFEYIKTSSEQIYAILEKMKGFKHLRYSNGNKSIANIMKGSFKTMSVIESNFTFTTDSELANYGLEKMKNADLMSIFINYIKNSIEANANRIHVAFIDFDKGYLTVRFMDNGNGIKKNIWKKVFDANFSTKAGVGETRGNGMYLSKYLLNEVKGDVKIVESTPKGTTFEIRIPAKLKK